MQKDRGLSAFVTFVMTVVIGTVMHFAYEWSGENKIVALFSAVNESTWEHLKLIFFPFIILAVIEYFSGGKIYKGYWTVKAEAVLLGMLSIIILFYTYNGVIGKSPALVNIAIFITGCLISSFYSYKFITQENKNNKSGIIFIMIFLILFMVFTFYTPDIALFLDPVTQTYGIERTS